MIRRNITGMLRGMVKGNILPSSIVPDISNAIVLESGGVADGTDNEVNDLIGTLDAAEYVENSCLTFDGATSVTYDSDACRITGDFILEVWMDKNATGTESIYSKYSTSGDNRALLIRRNSSSGRFEWFSSSDGTSGTLTTGYCLLSNFPSGYFKLVFTAINGDVTVTANGASIPVVGAIRSSIYDTDLDNTIGGGNGYYVGSLFGLKITNLETGTACLDSTMADGWGTAIHNRAGANDGTLVGATLSTAWGQTQDIAASNIDNGFSLYEHATDPAIRVSYLDTGVPNPSPTVPAGYTKTGDYPSGSYLPPAESSVLMTDPAIVNGMSIYGVEGIDDGTRISYNSLINGKGSWSSTSPSLGMVWDGVSKWQLKAGSSVLFEVLSSTSFPDRDGWTAVDGSGILTLVYNDVFVDPSTNEFRRVSYEDHEDHYEGSNGATGNWFKKDANGVFTKAVVYSWESHETMTPSLANSKERFYGGVSALDRDVDGELVLNADGTVNTFATNI